MRLENITPFILIGEEYMPQIIEEGVLYISEHWGLAIHNCACGCGAKSVTPLGKGEWTLTKNGDKVSLNPSIGNFSVENPYHAHYYITENKIMWC
jgi:hypothetical protein